MKTITDLSEPMYLEEEENENVSETGLIGDDPVQAKEQFEKQEQEKLDKAFEKQKEELQKIMETNMNKMGDALTNTYKEIMTGRKVKEDTK